MAGERRNGALKDEGTVLITENGAKVTVNYLISDDGAEADIYHVSCHGRDYALKWYGKDDRDAVGGKQYRQVERLMEKKCPGEEFIWPLDFVVEEHPADEGHRRFGFLMELIPEGYFEMERFLWGDDNELAVRLKGYNAVLTACMNIAAGMYKLHGKGLVFKDLQPKNLAIHPTTGAVCFVDINNISIDGEKGSVMGTMGYLAPEIARSGGKTEPDRLTDYYSLGVVLYQLLFIDHPMDGKIWEKIPVCTDRAEEYVYALHPVFHFHPTDKSNEVSEDFTPNVMARWKAYPAQIRDPFMRLFTEGIDNRAKRPTESEWISVFARVRDHLVRKWSDKKPQFVNFDHPKSVPPGCLRMKIENREVAVYPGKAVYEITISGDESGYAKQMGGILYDNNLGCLVLRNLSEDTYSGYDPKTKKVTKFKKGEQFPVRPGVQILFRESPRLRGVIS